MSLWEGLGLGLGLGPGLELEVESTLTSRSSETTDLGRIPLATALETAWEIVWEIVLPRHSRPREIVPRSYRDARL
jgi:hypothetical protein